MIIIRPYETADCLTVMEIWNSVVREGIAFPQIEELTSEEADAFFSSQTHTGVAVDDENGQND